jgi:ABC-type transport system substrate-binding protein
VRVSGNQLTITLTRAAPDLLARLGMPFFCAMPAATPNDPTGLVPAGAGPYYVAKRVPNRLIVLKRNPYYTGTRPHRPTEIDITVNTNQDASYLQVTRGDADYDYAGVPPSDLGPLASKYGINHGRFFVHPFMSVEYLALNTQRAPLTDPRIRHAINFAVSRTAVLAQNGFHAGTATDQILPPTLRGFRDAHIYPLTQPEIDKAKALLGGQALHLNLYTTIDQANVKQASVIQANLAKVGITVDIKQYAFGVLVSKIGVPTEPYDMVLLGWFADYADPYDFVNILLEGDKITKANNVNLARFNDPAFNKRIKQAALISGPRRYSTYSKLDVDISRVAAPWASLYNSNAREYVSSHVGCYIYQPVYAAIDLASACLK